MTPAEIIHIATVAARNEGWRFTGPFEVAKERRSFFGGIEWIVVGRGPTDEHVAWVRIDHATGEVLSSGWRLEEIALAA